VQELGRNGLDHMISSVGIEVVHVDNLDEVFVLA
jgi:hypothetical protein